MAETVDVSSKMLETLKGQLYTYQAENFTSEKLQKVRNQIDKLPSVLDSSTLQKLRNGEFEISLKEYSNLNTYKTMMSDFYGNTSADKFQNYINKVFATEENKNVNAKTFLDKMKENGMSNNQAIKLYSALKKYSIVSAYNNYNFVNAKI